MLRAGNTLLVLGGLLGFACNGDEEATSQGTSETATSAEASSAADSGAGGVAATSSSGGGVGGVGGEAGAGGSAAAGALPCVGGACQPSQVCCFDNVSTAQIGCAAPGACGAGQIELRCNHPDDCGPSATCCSAFDGMVQTMRCQATCDAADEFVMCSGPDQSACPAGTTCSPAQAGQGYHYCAK